MSATIAAVYRDGAFHPDTPPDLPDGTAVSLAVVAKPQSPGQAAFEMMRAIAEMPEQAGGDPNVTSDNHDEILYGGPDGAR